MSLSECLENTAYLLVFLGSLYVALIAVRIKKNKENPKRDKSYFQELSEIESINQIDTEDAYDYRFYSKIRCDLRYLNDFFYDRFINDPVSGDAVYSHLLAFAIMANADYISEDDFESILHSYFLKYPDNDFLLEAEWEFDYSKQLAAIIYPDHEISFNFNLFRISLMELLEKKFERLGIRRFVSSLYLVYNSIPVPIREEDEFFTMENVIDACDEGDTIDEIRDLCEEMFSTHHGWLLNEYYFSKEAVTS